MAGAASDAGMRSSVATATMTNTSRNVMRASTMNTRPSPTPSVGSVAPRDAVVRGGVTEGGPGRGGAGGRADDLGDEVDRYVAPREFADDGRSEGDCVEVGAGCLAESGDHGGEDQSERGGDGQRVGGCAADLLARVAAAAVAVPA